MTAVHQSLAAGRWQQLTLAEQLGNVGSEVYRAIRWRRENQPAFERALERALELLDLSITDRRWTTGRSELTRLREVLCDFLVGENLYRTEAAWLQRYFDQFAVMARK